jgi:hypothetical protein
MSMFKRFRLPVRTILVLLILLFLGLSSGGAQAAGQAVGAVAASSTDAPTWAGRAAPAGVAPTFRVTPGAVYLTIPLGRTPGPQILRVSNSSSAQLRWRLIAPRLNWLRVTTQPAAGMISRDGAAQAVTLRFRNLVAGRRYSTTLVFLDVSRHNTAFTCP